MIQESTKKMSAEGEDADIEYKPFSVGAVVSAALSFTALLTFINPVMVIFPLAAIALAILSYYQVTKSEKPMAGGKLALWAVGLAIVISSFAITSKVARDNKMYGLARQYSERWFDLIEKEDFYRTHQLTIQPEIRVNVDRDDHLQAFYDEEFVLVRPKKDAPEKPYEFLEVLKTFDPVASFRMLKKSGIKPEVKYLGRDNKVFRELNREIFSVIYEMTPSPYTKEEPLVFKLSMERKRYKNPKIGVQWRVTQRKYISGGPKQEVQISGG